MKRMGKFFAFISALWLSLSGCTNGFFSVEEKQGIDYSGNYVYAKYYTGAVSDGVYKIQAYNKGDSVVFPTTPQKDGYTFIAWYSDSNYENKVSNGTLTINSNIDLFAKFAEISKTFTVKFVNDDLVSVIKTTSDLGVGDKVALPAEPTSTKETGLTFAGWYLKADGSDTPLSGEYSVDVADSNEYEITFYAVYVKTEIPVTAIVIKPVAPAAQVGESVKLSVEYTPSDANKGKAITWSSDKPSVAAVDTNGNVNAVSAGTATITATTENGVTKSVTFTSTEIAYSISVSPTDRSLEVGQTYSFTAETSPADLQVIWSSSDAKVATVDQSGKVTAVAKGNATITAKIKDRSEAAEATVNVTSAVSDKPVSITLIAPSSIRKGNSTQLSAQVSYESGMTKTYTTGVIFSSSDTAIAEISENVLTAVKVGQAKISASYTEDDVTVRTTSSSTVEVMEGYRVHLYGDNWSGHYAYVYNKSGSSASNKNGEWPGESMTSEADGYYIDLDQDWIVPGTTLVIFTESKSTTNRYPADKADGVALPAGVYEAWFDISTKTWKTSNPFVTTPIVTITPASSVTLEEDIHISVSSKKEITAASISIAVNGVTKRTLGLADLGDKFESISVSSLAAANGSTITITGTVSNADGSSDLISQSLSVMDKKSVKIYVSADSAPKIWVWQSSGKSCSTVMGYQYASRPEMSNATDLRNNEGWYVFEIPEGMYDEGKNFSFIIGEKGDINSLKSETFWYDAKGVIASAGTYYDSDPTSRPEPQSPTVTASPASESSSNRKKLSINGGSIVVSATTSYNDTLDLSLSVTGGSGYSKTLTGLTKATSVTIPVSEISLANDVNFTLTVTAKGKTDGAVKTTTKTYYYVTADLKEDPFAWDNVNAYFVLTDRFYNGDTKNDHSYFRQNGLSGDEDVATFHGGDLAGLTAKMDYFDKLGVNAIWITAPYEQAHGWVGGKNGAFPHYAFHGYYTLDWTSMDQNMGTVEELRTFVNACHSRGIRVIMDVVMNHVGYNNTQDMITYKHGYTEHTDGWLAKTGGKWDANDTVQWDNSYWDTSWFGPWIRSFGYATGSEYGGTCGGLPDVKTELTSSVGMAPVLVTKWGQEKDSDPCTVAGTGNTTGNKIGDYRNPSVAATDWLSKNGDYRTDMKVAPADYQVAWLSAWVREVGIDGFRCDTAKHVEPFRWGQLKKACTAALEAWRNDSTKSKLYNGVDTGAADWDEAFWMTGECFGWTSTEGQGDYYTTGGFDSMINFSFNGSQGSGVSSNYPSESTWSSYININKNQDSDNNGNRNNVLTYLSSHDTKLCRPSDAYAQGTMFTLTPGGIQIYYGDESSRPQAYTGCGDSDMYTRGDMNWDEISGSKAALVAHWGKVGTFRKYNPAVGAGTGTATKRSYTGPAGDNKVAISISGTSVDVSGLFADGTTVYNWYDGTSAKVSDGKVTFNGGTTSAPILVSEKNPAKYGVTF